MAPTWHSQNYMIGNATPLLFSFVTLRDTADLMGIEP